MRIEVTTAHLERGIPADPCGCPVALAIRDALAARGVAPFSLAVTPWAIRVYLAKESDLVNLALPPLAASWLDAYDHNRRGIGPFAFELDLTPLGLAGVA